MAETFDVVVVGVGGMGAAALMHLAKRGLKVCGVEQHDVPNALGSSHGKARVIRKVYFEDPRYIPLLERSYELWRELERDSRQSLMHLVGCVNMGRPEHPFMRAVVDNARAYKLPHTILSAREICDRFPAFRLDDDGTIGVYEDDAGVLSPEACTRAHAEIAFEHGATLYTRERTTGISIGDGTVGQVVVTTEKRTIHAGAIVFAAGAWSPQLPGLAMGHALHAQRQVQCWFTPPDARFELGAFPVFIHFVDGTDLDTGHAYYGMPPWGGGGVKIARHGAGARITPDAVDRNVSDDDVDNVRWYLKRALPDLDAAASASEVCMYTMSPDGNFVVGKVKNNAVVLTGFSGHGYKMASVMGEIAADLVHAGRTKHDIAFFDPFRFG